jgi:hypothetical protein
MTHGCIPPQVQAKLVAAEEDPQAESDAMRTRVSALERELRAVKAELSEGHQAWEGERRRFEMLLSLAAANKALGEAPTTAPVATHSGRHGG